jgi:hypothetical protein
LTECESTAVAKCQNAGTALHARGFAPSVLQESFARKQYCRWFSTSTTPTTPDGSAGSVAPADSVGNTARELDASSIPRKVFVKRQGGADWAEVTAHGGMSVAGLKKQIMKEFPSLRDKDPDFLTLHVAKDNAGTDLGAALDSRSTLADAGVQSGASIVVKVVTAVSTGE